MNVAEEFPFHGGAVKKSPSAARVANANAFSGHTKGFPGGILIAADNDHRPGSHVFFFTDDARHASMTKISKRLRRMLQQAKRLTRLAR